MQYLVGLILISFITSAGAECQAPGQGFLEQKLKTSFGTLSGEKELKDVVLHPRNYGLREEVKHLDRRSKYADRLASRDIATVMQQKFDQMIVSTNRSEVITDFPSPGATSKLSGTDNSLEIEINNVSKDELDVLPPEVLNKLSNKVKIHYKYPYDKFEYFLTYDGRELPMVMAFNKMQADFEDACDQRLRDNQHSKDLWEQDRKIRGFSQLPEKSGVGNSGRQ